MSEETVLNLFVSSPGDVQRERERVDFVVERLNAEHAGRLRIRTIRWETRYYSSHDTFQAQILEAADCDLVLAIFGARLGSPLPDGFPAMPSGERYPSGTAYEVLSAMEARRQGRGIPDVFVFRRPTAPLVALDAADRAEIEAQWHRLGDFFETWFRNRSGQFLAAFQEFGSTDDFAAKVEDCLRQWLERHGFPPRAASWDRRRLGSPYPGLAAFDAARRSVFFGRSVAVEQALRRLRELEADPETEARPPFLLLIGASGSGKSSLLRAGLLPRVGEPGVLPEVDAWRPLVVVPGLDPFASIAEALLDHDVLGDELAATPFRDAGLLARQLAVDAALAVAPITAALAAVAETRRRDTGRESLRPARLFLAIDQAERLLDETPPEPRARFAALLAALCRHRLATVVMVLRSDAYPRFQTLDDLVELRSRGATLDLLPATASELEEMVTRPAAQCDPPLVFERRDGRSLAAVLVAEAHGGDALPLLQTTLSRLAAAEAARGDGVLRFADHLGLAEAVGRTADEVLADLTPEARARLPNLIAGLVRDFSLDPETGRAVPLVGALDRARFEAGRPECRALIDGFVARRLLVAEGDAGGDRVRPTHESLLRIWPQAVAILEEVSHLVRARAAIEPIAREWAEATPEDAPRHLEISPALLEAAVAWIDRFGGDAPAEIRIFVAAAADLAAARRDRERRDQERRIADAEAIARADRRIARTTGAGLAAALVLAGLAGWQWRAAVVAGEAARIERDRAERTLAVAAETADGLVFDLAQKFRNLAGIPKPVVRDILDRARRLQEQLIDLGTVDPKLEGGHAAALGETAATELALGDLPRALDLATRTRDVYARLAAAAPQEFRWVFDHAHAEGFLGGVLARQGRADEAEAAHLRAEAIAETGIARGLSDPRLRQLLATVLEDRGGLARSRGDSARALDLYRRSLAVTRDLAAARPDDMAIAHNLAVALRSVGDVELDTGDVAAADASFAAAAEVAARLAADHPENSLLQRDFTLGQERLGLALRKKGDLTGALKAFEDGERTALAMVASDPTNLEWAFDAAIGHLEIGDTRRALGDLAAARRAYGEARTIDTRLVARDPSNETWRRHLDDVLARLSTVLEADGDTEAAVASERDRVALAEAALAVNREAKDWSRRAVEAERRLGVLHVARDRTDEALAVLDRALARSRTLDETRGDRQALVAVLVQVAGVAAFAERPSEAAERFAEAEALARRLLVEDPKDATTRGQLAMLLIASASTRTALGEGARAVAGLREAVDLAAALAAETPGETRWPRERATALDRLGDALAVTGDPTAAIEAYRASLAALAALPDDPPTRRATEAAATMTREALAPLLADADRPREALAVVSEAVATRRDRLAGHPEAIAERRLLAGDLALATRLRVALSDLDGARTTRRENLALAREILAETGADPISRRDLAVALLVVGTEPPRPGDDPAAARAALEEAQGLVVDLLRAAPSDGALLRLAALAHRSLGTARLGAGDRAGAVEAFVAARDADRAALDHDPKDAAAAEAMKQDVARIGLAADALLRARDPAGALAALDRATPVAPDQAWLDLVRAGSLMMLDRTDEALRVLDRRRGERSANGRSWETEVRDAVARLRAEGIDHPFMKEIEARFAPTR